MYEKSPIRVVVVDDSPVFRELVVEQVAATPGHDLVGTAERGEDALQVVGATRPDVVLMDVRMPGIGGIEAAVRIRDAFPEVVLVFMSIDLASLPDDDRERMAGWPQVEKRLLRPPVLASLWHTHRPR
jgi:chemotaxis response regulator CheB